MRKWTIWILALAMLFSAACAESLQKAPDYIMEGFDGGVTAEFHGRLVYRKSAFQVECYPEWSLVDKALDRLTEEEKEKFLFANARAFYGFDHLPEVTPVPNML